MLTNRILVFTGAAIAVGACMALWSARPWSPEAKEPSAAASRGLKPQAAQEALKRLSDRPVLFEENNGQAPSDVAFLARGTNSTVFLSPNRMAMSVPVETAEVAPDLRRVPNPALPPLTRSTYMLVSMDLVGASEDAVARAEGEPAAATTHYDFNAPTGRANIRAELFESVRFDKVYPGIDVRYHAGSLAGSIDRANAWTRALEYDFILEPGADPDSILLLFRNVEGTRITREGDLKLATGAGELLQARPVAFQQVEGERVEVAAAFAPRGKNLYAFELGDYDPRSPLIIDPVLAFATGMGGPGSDRANSIAVDADDNIAIFGTTSNLSWLLGASGGTLAAALANGDRFAQQGEYGFALYNGNRLTIPDSSIKYGGFYNAEDGQNVCITYDSLRSNPFNQGPVNIIGSAIQNTAFVTCLDASLTPQWTTGLGGPGQDFNDGAVILQDGADPYLLMMNNFQPSFSLGNVPILYPSECFSVINLETWQPDGSSCINPHDQSSILGGSFVLGEMNKLMFEETGRSIWELFAGGASTSVVASGQQDFLGAHTGNPFAPWAVYLRFEPDATPPLVVITGSHFRSSGNRFTTDAAILHSPRDPEEIAVVQGFLTANPNNSQQIEVEVRYLQIPRLNTLILPLDADDLWTFHGAGRSYLPTIKRTGRSECAFAGGTDNPNFASAFGFPGPDNNSLNAFVGDCLLDPQTGELLLTDLYFIEAPGDQYFLDLACDNWKNKVACGLTTGPGFPALGEASQSSYGGGDFDIIVAAFYNPYIDPGSTVGNSGQLNLAPCAAASTFAHIMIDENVLTVPNGSFPARAGQWGVQLREKGTQEWIDQEMFGAFVNGQLNWTAGCDLPAGEYDIRVVEEIATGPNGAAVSKNQAANGGPLLSNIQTVNLVAAAPQWALTGNSGVCLNASQNNVLVSEADPADPGDVLQCFFFGGGQSSPPCVSIAPLSPLLTLTTPFAVTLGSRELGPEALAAFITPTYTCALNQGNFAIPADYGSASNQEPAIENGEKGLWMRVNGEAVFNRLGIEPLP